MRHVTSGVRHHARTAHLIAIAAAAALLGGAREARAQGPDAPLAPLALATSDSVAPALPLDSSLFGRSGKLRARLVSAGRHLPLRYLTALFGDSSAHRPGIYALPDSAARPLAFINLLPFAEKRGSRIGSYRMGFWPAERRAPRSDAYANPDGFILVTRENQDTRVSEHFRLRDFLTKGRSDVWPKYLVLREDLVDKLELVIADLEARGVAVERMRVMSGFRTPSYNANGGNTAGRASNSRHMYGDAADVFVDNDGDWRMDDLNGDGRSDTRDAAVIRAAVERVERAWPDLVGGVGVYRATSAHGPFAHVDVRGYRARWGSE